MKKLLAIVLLAFSSLSAAQTVTCDKSFVLYGNEHSKLENVETIQFMFDKNNPMMQQGTMTAKMKYDVGQDGPIIANKNGSVAFLLTKDKNVIMFQGNSPVHRVYICE